MSLRDVHDAQPTLLRAGAAVDRIAAAGHAAVARAVAGHVRERRGRLQRVDTTRVSGHGLFTGQHIARELVELTGDLERLADTLEARR